MTITVAVNGVEKRYGAVKALRNVSFDLGPGRLNAAIRISAFPRWMNILT